MEIQNIRNLLLIFIGGGIGSVCRYGLGAYMLSSTVNRFPLPTFIANTLGCLCIGLLMGYFSNRPTNILYLLFVTGFCGGFTTFSTFSNETFQFVRQGMYALALSYVLLSFFVGLLSVALGFYLCKNVV